MADELTIIKLGGALLTDKSRPYTAREDVIEEVSSEIAECLNEGLLGSLVLTFGVGSFGHPPVIEHEIHRGFQGPEQLHALGETQYVVNRLRMMLCRHLLDAGIPVNLMHASSMVTANKMVFQNYFLEPLRGYLSLGMVIAIGGDVVYDTAMGFSVTSSDSLAVTIARELDARRILFATDVDGVYDRDPRTFAEAKLLKEVSLNEIDTLIPPGSDPARDASGRMRGKLKALLRISEMIAGGTEVYIFSMMRRGNLKSLLSGEDVTATRVVA
ncbi:MAG: isopentenyl phosphate kinase [Candidatus Thorarchaeota archaeon]